MAPNVQGAKKPSYATAYRHTYTNPAPPLPIDTHIPTQLRHCIDTYTHARTALRRSFTTPGSRSNTISVLSLCQQSHSAKLNPISRSPKQSVPQSTCDRLFMNISYTGGLKGSTLAWLRALWQLKEPTEMNSDTRRFRLRKGKRREKINRVRKAAVIHFLSAVSGTLLGRSVPCSTELHGGS
jgi:hypothetical protein